MRLYPGGRGGTPVACRRQGYSVRNRPGKAMRRQPPPRVRPAAPPNDRRDNDMASKHDEPVDLKRPALELLYGSCEKKRRVLDRDVLIVGRARGCDIGLEAPDVSSLHCVITRSPY